MERWLVAFEFAVRTFEDGCEVPARCSGMDCCARFWDEVLVWERAVSNMMRCVRGGIRIEGQRGERKES